MTIKRGAVFTLESNASISIGAEDDFESIPLKGDLTGTGDAPKIVMEGSSAMYYRSYTTYYYFYAHNYNGEEGAGAQNDKTIPNGTYEWVASVKDGTSFAGWKATE